MELFFSALFSFEKNFNLLKKTLKIVYRWCNFRYLCHKKDRMLYYMMLQFIIAITGFYRSLRNKKKKLNFHLMQHNIYFIVQTTNTRWILIFLKIYSNFVKIACTQFSSISAKNKIFMKHFIKTKLIK